MKLKNIGEKELILSLIKDDLINVHLVGGLSKIGINADDHYLHLSETFFKLMGFDDSERDEKLYEAYFNYSHKIVDIPIVEQFKKLDNMALDIYVWLLEEKTKRLYEKLPKKLRKKLKHGKKKNQ